MEIVTFFMCLLFIVTLLIRRRFITNSYISIFLRKKYVAKSLFRVFFVLHCTAIFIWVMNSGPYYVLNNQNFICGLTLLTAWCIVSQSFMVRGTIQHTYFTMIGFTLKIDISRQFIPEINSHSEMKAFANNFAQQLLSLDNIPCDRIIFHSHLIQPTMRGKISGYLNTHDIAFFEEAYDTGKMEIISLNLLYGGRTRYHIFSTVRHKNGFKVHKTGSRFVISPRVTHLQETVVDINSR